MAITTNVPSDQFEDLQRDVQDATRFANGSSAFQNRTGSSITPIPVLNQQFLDALSAVGYEFLDPLTFTTGAEITTNAQALRRESDNEYFRWAGALPKTVAPGTDPASDPLYIAVGSGALRQDLIDGTANIFGETAEDVASFAVGSKQIMLASKYATPDVAVDQSLALQAAWQLAADNNATFVIDRVFWVGLNVFNPPTIGANRPTSLHAVSNSEVWFTNEAAIKLLPNSEPLYYVINFYTAENVRMYFPVVYGDRFDHTGVLGESGNCFNITSCKNIYLHKPKAYDAWGDGYYIGREFFTNIADAVEFVTLFEPEGYNSSRNDISLTHGHDIKIIRPHTQGVFRTAPGAGIDIEPEFGDNVAVEPTLRRVVIDSPVSIGKVSGILTVFNRPISDFDVSIVGTAVDYDSSNPLQLIRTEAMTGSVGMLSIDEFKTTNCFGNPMLYSWFADNTCKVVIGRLVHTKANRGNDALYRHAIEISRDGSTSGDLTIGQVINAGSPNCLEPYRIFGATTLQNTKIDFVSTGRSNNGGVVTSTALQGRTCRLTTPMNTLSLTGLSTAGFYSESYDVNTASGSISFELSGNVRAKQSILKVASANTLTLTASVTKSIFKLDGSAVSSISATAGYSYIEFMDDGGGNKIITCQRGNWV